MYYTTIRTSWKTILKGEKPPEDCDFVSALCGLLGDHGGSQAPLGCESFKASTPRALPPWLVANCTGEPTRNCLHVALLEIKITMTGMFTISLQREGKVWAALLPRL